MVCEELGIGRKICGGTGRHRLSLRHGLATAARGGHAPQAPVDDEMAEIEALLKKRGIE